MKIRMIVPALIGIALFVAGVTVGLPTGGNQLPMLFAYGMAFLVALPAFGIFLVQAWGMDSFDDEVVYVRHLIEPFAAELVDRSAFLDSDEVPSWDLPTQPIDIVDLPRPRLVPILETAPAPLRVATVPSQPNFLAERLALAV